MNIAISILISSILNNRQWNTTTNGLAVDTIDYK